MQLSDAATLGYCKSRYAADFDEDGQRKGRTLWTAPAS
jgi:hypothetical protein